MYTVTNDNELTFTTSGSLCKK